MNITSQLVRSASLAGDTDEDTECLREMLQEARDFIRAFTWAPEIEEIYFGGGVGGILALFLFVFRKPVCSGDRYLWVVVGDLPAAYFVVDRASSPRLALDVYCELMENWADAVLTQRSIEKEYPIAVEATIENATMLLSRVRFLREHIAPTLRSN